jgi:hypothetical protein
MAKSRTPMTLRKQGFFFSGNGDVFSVTVNPSSLRLAAEMEAPESN